MPVHLFVPRIEPLKEWDMGALRALHPDLSDSQFAGVAASFDDMRRRVENPRRRIGCDVFRAGPVLFDPCQYLDRAGDDAPISATGDE